MNLVAGSIRNPIAIAVAVFLVCLFGALSLVELPLQLFPDIERPTISIFTNWRGASPEEVEAELLEPQEQVLQGLPGVEEINGNAAAGGSQIFLTFAIGTDMKSALVDVIGRMSRLPPMPREVDRPFVQLGGAEGDDTEPGVGHEVAGLGVVGVELVSVGPGQCEVGAFGVQEPGVAGVVVGAPEDSCGVSGGGSRAPGHGPSLSRTRVRTQGNHQGCGRRRPQRRESRSW